MQLDLPTGTEVRMFGVRIADGQPIGSLVVVERMSHSSYVDQLFEARVEIVRDAEPMEDGACCS